MVSEYLWIWVNMSEYKVNMSEYEWKWVNKIEIWVNISENVWILVKDSEYDWIWVNVSESQWTKVKLIGETDSYKCDPCDKCFWYHLTFKGACQCTSCDVCFLTPSHVDNQICQWINTSFNSRCR